METIAERIGICKHCLTDETRFCHTDCDQYTMYKAAVRQKEIDDIDLKETQRQRDECYDELVKLRTEKIEWKEKACKWLKSQADECFVSGDSVGEHLVFKDLNLAEFLKAMEK